nr:acyl-CoA oxidase [Cardiosporidium cionae]
MRSILDAFANEDLASSYESATFSPKLLALAKNLGPGGLQIREYGCAGLTSVEVMLLAIEMFRMDASFSTFYLVQNGLALPSIAVAGSAEQKAKWIPSMARFDKIGAFGLTEPEAGSDATNLKTTAQRVSGGWILNGRKRWIGNATFADVTVIWAKNLETHHINGFLVEKGTAGFFVSKIAHKMALRMVQNADITLKDCFVPESSRLLIEGFSGSTAKVLEASRAVVAMGSTGLLIGAYERALNYCLQRQQFGKSLVGFQLVQERLMQVLGKIQGMAMSSLHLARLLDKGEAQMAQIALSKAWCTKTAREGVSLCREILGGNGIVYDFGVAMAFLDAEAMYTYEGTYDINALLAGRLITGVNSLTS